jgi:hypothetical protein
MELYRRFYGNLLDELRDIMKVMNISKKVSKLSFGVLCLLAILFIGFFIYKEKTKIPDQDFLAPGKSWQSTKKVDDYFTEKLHFTQSDFERQKQSETVDFRPGKGSTLEAIVSNLKYYGFIRSEKALMYALENTKDTTQGNPGSLLVGKDGSLDTTTSYRISENMTAWELADTLLNKGHYFGPNDEYNYMFMP